MAVRRRFWLSVARAALFGVAALLVGFPMLERRANAEETDLDGLEEQAVRAAVDAVAPCVVRIETTGGMERAGEVLLGSGPTTGLVVGADGWIVSSAFSFVRQPASILVTLADGKRVAAQIVARDRSRMLVLLKAAVPQPLPVPEAAPPSEMFVGQWTIAVGRSMDATQPNVSVGVLSARNRIWGKAVQTDAKVSPSNYGGPLVDIRGRVMGVLVPLSPDAIAELAGAEWYDSGIGFAVPLADIQQRLARLQSGKDIFPGLLGISFKEGDIYSSLAPIAAVSPRSPASDAGLKTGDQIVAVNGKPVSTQIQLKHIIGPLDAGEKVQLSVTRGTEKVDAVATLVDKLIPYEHPFIGLLPMRGGAAAAGTAVRYVYADSGAAAAGLKVGDRVLELDGKPMPQADSLRLAVSARQPGETVEMQVERSGQKLGLKVKLSALPITVPAELPAGAPASQPRPDGPKTGLLEVKVAESRNACVAWVPEDYDPKKSYGLVVQLPPPGEFVRDDFSKQWSEPCKRLDLIALAPQSTQQDGWQPTEGEMVRKAIEQMAKNYSIDRNRIVTFGKQAGGSMAIYVALRHRDLVRGTVVHEASIPGHLELPDNSPVERLAFYLLAASDSKLSPRIDAAAKRLGEMKYPVTVKKLANGAKSIENGDFAEVLRWIDSLDRI